MMAPWARWVQQRVWGWVGADYRYAACGRHVGGKPTAGCAWGTMWVGRRALRVGTRVHSGRGGGGLGTIGRGEPID